VFDLPKGGVGCDALSPATFPVRYDVSFEGDIRQFINNQCAGCHGGSGNLSLAAGNIRSALLVDTSTGLETGRVAESQPTPTPATPILRVRPGEPEQSMLFLRINCADPGAGTGRMPLGGVAPLEFQALLHDWIAAGALLPSEPESDRISIGSMESITRPTLPSH
jgi:hypothetical protein